MTKLRRGDIVTLRAVINDVADYDGGQQVMVQLLPKGKPLGWLIQKETAFEVDEFKIAVGDKVKVIDRPGHLMPWTVKALFDNEQVAIQKDGSWPVEMNTLKNLRRID